MLIKRQIDQAALTETDRRREIQLQYNKDHNITPKTTNKPIGSALANLYKSKDDQVKKDAPQRIKDVVNLAKQGDPTAIDKEVTLMRKQMVDFATDLEFEKAAKLRDQIHDLEKLKMRI